MTNTTTQTSKLSSSHIEPARLARLCLLASSLLASAPPSPAAAQVLAPGGNPVPKPPVAIAAPPLSLTASDGSGLELVSLSAEAVIESPLAFTELRLVFRNPESRVREGRFRITLPPTATISRFAMRIGDRWQEGEVVEQHAARVAYEDFLHRRQDPALLEAEAGNEFSARVFPIPPGANKEIIVSYSEELPHAKAPYRLALRGLPRIGNLIIRASVDRAGGGVSVGGSASNLGGRRSQRDVVGVEEHAFKPDRDFEIASVDGGRAALLRHDNLVVARVTPLAETDRRDDLPSLAVLVDTSASRALGLGDEVAALQALLAELRKAGSDPVLTVAAFDQEVVPLYIGRASAMGDGVRKRILERRALGASDLERALTWVAGAVKKDPRARVLLVGDGVATAGETTADKLRAKVKILGSAGVGRLDVLATGGIRDDVLLSRLVTAGLARDGVVLDATQPAPALARRLTRATRSGVKVEVDGAGWVWPSTLNGIQPGDEVLVYADLPAGRPFQLRIDGKTLAASGAPKTVERPLLERAWVKARISRLVEQRDGTAATDRDLAEALKKEAIDLSIKNRVLCPFTSLLVLETEQDYARFGIERRALADILTVGAGGIAVIHRSDYGAADGSSPWAAEGSERGEETQGLSPTARPLHPTLADPRGPGLAKGMRDDGAALADKRKESEKKSEPKVERRAMVAHAQAEPVMDMEMSATPAESDRERQAPASGQAQRLGPRQADRAEGRAESGAEASRSMSSGSALAAPAMAAAAPPPPAPMAVAAPRAHRMVAPRAPVPAMGGFALAPAEASGPSPFDGALKTVMDLIHKGQAREALAQALAWRQRDAGDVLALVALGECWEALGNVTQAARAYGSIIDLFPGRADMRRFAGERLERVRGGAALALAVDSYRCAVEQRPDHPAGHRLLAFALLKLGHPHQAFDALVVGLAQRYPSDRFRGVDRILREDLGLAAAAWTRVEPTRTSEIAERLARNHGVAETEASLRFVLNWETDANDVDFHIHDARGGHAYYSAPRLPSGGSLYADVTTGYGPECFTIRGADVGRAAPYRLQAHYYSRGPMGYGMGKLEIVEHDGHGGLRFEERPFVIMQDGAFVNLGMVTGSAGKMALAR